MGMLDIDGDCPVYFDELSHNFVPLRPPKMYIVSQAQPAHTHMTSNLPVRRVLIYDLRQHFNMGSTIVWISSVPLRFVSPSTLLVTSHHHLRSNPQPPIATISAVRFIWIRGMAISFMAIHMGCVVGVRVERFMDLCVLAPIIPFVLLLVYYHIFSRGVRSL
eukprot:6174326-Pleurochrysis_carterae.AAC.1